MKIITFDNYFKCYIHYISTSTNRFFSNHYIAPNIHHTYNILKMNVTSLGIKCLKHYNISL